MVPTFTKHQPEITLRCNFLQTRKTIKFTVRSLQIEGWGDQNLTKNELQEVKKLTSKRRANFDSIFNPKWTQNGPQNEPKNLQNGLPPIGPDHFWTSFFHLASILNSFGTSGCDLGALGTHFGDSGNHFGASGSQFGIARDSFWTLQSPIQ